MPNARRTYSFVFGGLGAAVFLVIGIVGWINGGGVSSFGFFAALAALTYTFISCLILANNFIGEMVVEVLSWGFVSLPGIIFELSLDGIIWLLTVKLLFWILGILLAAACGILAVILGAIVSVFVYPFALVKSFKEA